MEVTPKHDVYHEFTLFPKGNNLVRYNQNKNFNGGSLKGIKSVSVSTYLAEETHVTVNQYVISSLDESLWSEKMETITLLTALSLILGTSTLTVM